MKKQFFVIEPMNLDGSLGEADVEGPFNTIKQAEDFLRREVVELCQPNSNDLSLLEEPENWAMPAYIVQVVKRVQQIPVLNVTAELREIK